MVTVKSYESVKDGKAMQSAIRLAFGKEGAKMHDQSSTARTCSNSQAIHATSGPIVRLDYSFIHYSTAVCCWYKSPRKYIMSFRFFLLNIKGKKPKGGKNKRHNRMKS